MHANGSKTMHKNVSNSNSYIHLWKITSGMYISASLLTYKTVIPEWMLVVTGADINVPKNKASCHYELHLHSKKIIWCILFLLILFLAIKSTINRDIFVVKYCISGLQQWQLDTQNFVNAQTFSTLNYWHFAYCNELTLFLLWYALPDPRGSL